MRSETPRPAPSLNKPSTEPNASGKRLGMLGGGQLGLMFAEAARRIGCRVTVLAPDPQCPAAAVADEHLVAEYDDAQALATLGARCDAIGYEFEAVPAASVRQLEARTPVHPDARALAVAQSRLAEKRFAAAHAPATPPTPHAAITHAAQLPAALERLGPACILKTDQLGYDGKGQARVRSAAEAEQAFAAHGGRPCVLERALELESEVSVIVARNTQRCVTYPVAENEHRGGILHRTCAPADIDASVRQTVQDSARALARALDYRGVLAVEYFLAADGIYFNEMAPRPHNSGHYTLDACRVSQFEQQARILCELPPGNPAQHTPAVMINLLGDLWRDGEPDWTPLREEPSARLHLYGKRQARAGRKMGHFCVLDADLAAARARADELYASLAA